MKKELDHEKIANMENQLHFEEKVLDILFKDQSNQRKRAKKMIGDSNFGKGLFNQNRNTQSRIVSRLYDSTENQRHRKDIRKME